MFKRSKWGERFLSLGDAEADCKASVFLRWIVGGIVLFLLLGLSGLPSRADESGGSFQSRQGRPCLRQPRLRRPRPWRPCLRQDLRPIANAQDLRPAGEQHEEIRAAIQEPAAPPAAAPPLAALPAASPPLAAPPAAGSSRSSTDLPREISTAGITTQKALRQFLDSLENLQEELGARYSLELYNQYRGKDAPHLQEYQDRLVELSTNTDYAAIVLSWKDKVRNHELGRRLFLHGKNFLLARLGFERVKKIEDERLRLEEVHQEFRPLVRGQRMTRAKLRELLKHEKDRETRHEAWSAYSELSQTTGKELLSLMRERNRAAQDLGFPSEVEWELYHSDLSKKEILDLFHELEELTREAYRELLQSARFELGVELVEPWDLSYFLERKAGLPSDAFPKEKALGSLLTLVRELGFKPEALPVQIENADIPFGGLTFSIRIPGDVRILNNPVDGIDYFRIFFHEYGHALQFTHTSKDLSPILKEGGPGLFHEGMAQIFARFLDEEEWLKEHFSFQGVSLESFLVASRLRQTYRIRSLLASALFEMRAYENLDQDLRLLWQKVQEEILFFPERKEDLWASDTFLVTHPVYVPNYLLADMVAAQTWKTLKERFGERFWRQPLLEGASSLPEGGERAGRSSAEFTGSRSVAQFLIDRFFSTGSSLDWKEKIRRATAAPLSARALAEELKERDFQPKEGDH